MATGGMSHQSALSQILCNGEQVHGMNESDLLERKISKHRFYLGQANSATFLNDRDSPLKDCTDSNASYFFFLQHSKRQTSLFSCWFSHCNKKCTLETKLWLKNHILEIPQWHAHHWSTYLPPPFCPILCMSSVCTPESMCLFGEWSCCFSKMLLSRPVAVYMILNQQNKHHHSHYLN